MRGDSGISMTFSLFEWLALTGLFQSLMVLVYMILRVRNWQQGAVAVSCFFTLSAIFALQFSMRLEALLLPLTLALWLCWVFFPLLCHLLVLQVARAPEMLPRRRSMVLLALPCTAVLGWGMWNLAGVCGPDDGYCDRFFQILYWLAGISGALSMLALWWEREVFGRLWRQEGSRERYWLCLMLVVMNMGASVVHFLRADGTLPFARADAVLTVLGMSFVYLASTLLFRIYPLPVRLGESRLKTAPAEGAPDEKIVREVRRLMDVEKVYQEPSFSRADMARELKVSESVLSQVVNTSFGKSFPRLLGEYRVEDAKRLLLDPSLSVQVVARESGFNSIASFNRVFREVTGKSPSAWREERKKTAI